MTEQNSRISNKDAQNGIIKMPSLIESHLISIAEKAFGYHYIQSETKTLRELLAPGETIAPRYNLRGTEFLCISEGSATVNSTPLSEGDTIRVNPGDIVEISTEKGCEIISHVIPYRKPLCHIPYKSPNKSEINKGIKVSIIIIAKDIEYYIGKSIISCLNQTHKNIEIIVVDDNSKDKTNQISHQIKKFDDRISIYSVDRGPNGARKFGLQKSSGDYFLIIDGDDWITSDAIEVLLDTVREMKSDLAIIGFDHYNDMNRNFWDWVYPSEKSEVKIPIPLKMSPSDALKHSRLNHTIWMNFFSNRLKKVALEAMCDLYLYEDLPFSLSLLNEAQNPTYCNTILYHYRRERAGQATHTWQSVPSLRKQACLQKAVLHTLSIIGGSSDMDKVILLYKINNIIGYELGISNEIEASQWREMKKSLFQNFDEKISKFILDPSLKREFIIAHNGKKAFL